MDVLKVFVENLCGKFNNYDQINDELSKGEVLHPKASHINGVCNHKIKNLPEQGNRKNILPHLFLFTLNDDNKVVLESYELPKGVSQEEFRNDNEDLIMDYNKLAKSEKFTPMVYNEENGVFTGESTSMFSPVTKFILKERVENGMLYVSEVFYKGDKKTFGFEDPIVYKKIN